MIQDLISLIFPRYCPACKNTLHLNEHVLCYACIHRLPKTNYHRFADNPLLQIFDGRVHVQAAAAYYFFRKKGRVQRLLHELKYRRSPEIGEEVGMLFGKELRQNPLYETSELIIPVPLHPDKEKARGYNQSACFARGLEQSLPAKLDLQSLVRRGNTESQTRKSRYERWENVEEVFQIDNSNAVRNRNILLVDDVITTGATIEACGHRLIEAGAAGIRIACIAVPPPQG